MHRTLTALTAAATLAALATPATATELHVDCREARFFVGHEPERAWQLTVNGGAYLEGTGKGWITVPVPLGGDGNVQLWTATYRHPTVLRSAPQAIEYFTGCPTEPTHPVEPPTPVPPAATPQPAAPLPLPSALVEPPITLPAPVAPRAPRATPLRRRALTCARLTRAGAGPKWRARYRCGPAPRPRPSTPAVAGERR